MPEDVLGLGAASQQNLAIAAQLQIGADLENPDIIRAAVEGDVLARDLRRGVEFVETGDESLPPHVSSVKIQGRRRHGPPGGVGVRCAQITLGRS